MSNFVKVKDYGESLNDDPKASDAWINIDQVLYINVDQKSFNGKDFFQPMHIVLMRAKAYVIVDDEGLTSIVGSKK